MKNIILKDINERDLSYFGERAEPYFCSRAIISGMQNVKRSEEFFGLKNTVRWLQLNYFFYQFSEDLTLIEKESEEKLLNEGNKYVDRLIDKCLEVGENLVQYSQKLGLEIGNSESRKSLETKVLNYEQAVSDYTIFYQLTFFEGALMRLAEKVSKQNSDNSAGPNKIIDSISVVDRLTASEHEYDDFLRMASTGVENIKENTELHAKKYGWLGVRYFLGEAWGKSEILNRLNSVSKKDAERELKERLSHREQMENNIQNIIKDFSVADKELVKIIRKIVYLRTQRGDFLHESASRARPFLNELAKALDVSYIDMINLSASEIAKALNGDLTYKKHIEERKKNFLIYHNWSEQGWILEGAEVENYLKTHLFLKTDIKNVSELKGKIGYKGSVKGTVKIIKTSRDIEKVIGGDIIVTTMTTANLMPALQKASAFITDEGGITCHAAIIAREMRKPCIIGTKIATRVLKDGDLVEVDANIGVVKMLKQ